MSVKNAQPNPIFRFSGAISLIGLIALGLVWELFLAPIRPGGSWLVLKVIPLLLPLRGVLKGNVYTFQWACMLILLYFMEGVVRAWSDPSSLSAQLAIIEIILSFVFYLSALAYLRPAKQAARRARQHHAATEKGES